MDTAGPSCVLDAHCYCNTSTVEQHMIPCIICKKFFHRECLKDGPPSALAGDIYFKLTCGMCSSDGKEITQRIKLQWTLVVILALFNLQLKGSGKCGYFRWREDICRFIDQNWTVFFGADRKKAATWHHTIAGTLSTNCNRYFLSGAEILGEKGWWALKDLKLPTIEDLEVISNSNKTNRKGRTASSLEAPPIVEGTRQRKQNVVEAALKLKAKHFDNDEHISRNKRKKTNEDLQVKITLSKTENLTALTGGLASTISDTIPSPITPMNIKTEKGLFWNESVGTNINTFIKEEPVDSNSVASETEAIAEWLKQGETPSRYEMDFEIDVDPPGLPPVTSDLSDVLLEDLLNDTTTTTPRPTVKIEEISDGEDNTLPSVPSPQKSVPQKKILENQHLDTSRKRKVVIKEEKLIPEERVISELKFVPMTVYEEQQLLTKLESLRPFDDTEIQARNLYRKLVVRKLKRERNLPVFDIDNFVRNASGMEPLESDYAVNNRNFGQQEILDRYQSPFQTVGASPYHYTSFISRLMGLDDDELEPFVSPYTKRVLKPFIFRDYETTTPKLKLLMEIISHPHRNDPSWNRPPRYPIDFCYVRPQHIPAINALCQEFFWPGIDLSESLQYPDFSCVVLYRKLIIGFAFMVPDVKYNEAYITFIFCHPEWRRCGIATFMLYHLIQTCMGKDITLHVSATSSAVFLYQKFGFKVEECIHDFYDKYLPATSTECRHALFLRLNR